MSERFTAYLDALQRLIAHLKTNQNDPDYHAALVFQQRLSENIDQQKLGDTEQLRHDRTEIIRHLNPITQRTHNMSFFEYIKLTDQPLQPQRAPKPGFLLSANDYIVPLHKAVQEGITFLSQDSALWPDECKRLRNKFQRFNNHNDIPYDNPALIQLRINLLHLDQQTDGIINLLDAFCPECNRSGNRLSKQRQETCEKLKMLLYEIEQVIASINALIKIHE